MKKYILILGIVSLLSACGKLDKFPLTTLSPANFWNTETDLRMALNSLYTNDLSDIYMDSQTADTYGASANTVSSGTYLAPNNDGVWNNAYTQIRTTNDFLGNYTKAQVTDVLKNRYAGEARFFRAYFYFWLVKRFGDVPYVDKTLDLSSPELYGPRTPRDTVINKILADIQFAVNNIPQQSAIKGDIGRITKGAALTLQARVALYFGTYFKFHTEVTTSLQYKDLLILAQTASKAVIDSKEYSLYKDYRNLFLQGGNDCTEQIMTMRHTANANTTNLRARAMIYDLTFDPTKQLADAFLCSDGLPVDKSPLFRGYLPNGTEFNNRDPRMSLTIWRPSDPNYQTPAQPFKCDFTTNSATGYMFKKYAFDALPSSANDILMRYAEDLLTYAEATYELNNSISDADLDISINALRARFTTGDAPIGGIAPNTTSSSTTVALPKLTNSFITTNGLDMRTEIHRERRVELAAEGFHYDDIIRWKTAGIELPVALLGVKLDNQAYPTVTKPLDANGFVIVQAASTRFFDANKNYLFPIPLQQIGYNPKLTQNPGW